jgi:uncharacterized protein (TIGR03083 family)
MVTSGSMKDLAAAERRDLADFLATLTPEQWERPSLCAGWTVRDVVAHVLSYEEVGWPGVAALFVRGRFGVHRTNALALEACRHRSPAELLALLRAHLEPRGFTAAFGGAVAFADGTIHHQDIRRALDAPREIPQDRLLRLLSFAVRGPTFDGPEHSRGLHLVATDVDWEHGDGPEVRGPGEAIVMAVAGRPDALADLTGEGVATLRRRIS